MSNSWQHFSVEEFFSQNNWSGTVQTDADNVLQEIPWLCQKIEEFYGHSNWQGEILSEISQPKISLTLSVAGFMQLFAWESDSQSAFIPKLAPLPEWNSAPNDELNIDDFGNLF